GGRTRSCDPQPRRRVAATLVGGASFLPVLYVATLSPRGGWLPRVSRGAGRGAGRTVAILSHPGGWLPPLGPRPVSTESSVAILSHPGGWLPPLDDEDPDE